MLQHEQPLIVYPDRSAVFQEHSGASYEGLTRHLLDAARETLPDVAFLSSGEVRDATMGQLNGATVMVVDPLACTLGRALDPDLFSALATARRRIAISVGPVGNERYRRQFRLPIDFDAVFDVGFVDQREEHPLPALPYRFVPDGPTTAERRTISAASPSMRPIPWALAMLETSEEVDLLTKLIEGVDPAGVVCLHVRTPTRLESLLGVQATARLLSRTGYYVWASRDSSTYYYESPRFLEALLAGAAPCKIGSTPPKSYGIPGLFLSVESFRARDRESGPWSLYREARDYYLSRRSLGHQLEAALRLV